MYLRESFYAIYPKVFSGWFLSRNGGRKHKFETFFFNEKLLMNLSKSVLTDGRCQNLPKSRSLL